MSYNLVLPLTKTYHICRARKNAQCGVNIRLHKKWNGPFHHIYFSLMSLTFEKIRLEHNKHIITFLYCQVSSNGFYGFLALCYSVGRDHAETVKLWMFSANKTFYISNTCNLYLTSSCPKCHLEFFYQKILVSNLTDNKCSHLLVYWITRQIWAD